jgi:hypothetical protein
MIAAHQPTFSPLIRRPQMRITSALSAAAIAEGKRAAKSFSPKM